MHVIGSSFEIRAKQALERAGLKLLARNYITRYGEIDLIMRDADTVVFVEVRYRAHAGHGDASASITRAKRDRLIRSADLWLAAHPHTGSRACRFDVVCYSGPSSSPHMRWLRNAFDAH